MSEIAEVKPGKIADWINSLEPGRYSAKIVGKVPKTFFTNAQSAMSDKTDLLIDFDFSEATFGALPENPFKKFICMSSVKLPKGLPVGNPNWINPEGICRKSFEDCDNLESVEIIDGDSDLYTYDSVLYKDTTAVFCPRKRSGEVKIKDGTAGIDAKAFEFCQKITKINFPDTIEYIGESAFSCARSLTEIILPPSVRSIGFRAFESCQSAKHIIIPPTIKRLPDRSLSGLQCDGCSVELNEGLTEIESNSFFQSNGLVEIKIPDSVTKIGQQAFYECNNLQKVCIGASVESISENAFTWCSHLRVFEVVPTNKTYKSIDGVLCTADGKPYIIPEGKDTPDIECHSIVIRAPEGEIEREVQSDAEGFLFVDLSGIKMMEEFAASVRKDQPDYSLKKYLISTNGRIKDRKAVKPSPKVWIEEMEAGAFDIIGVRE